MEQTPTPAIGAMRGKRLVRRLMLVVGGLFVLAISSCYLLMGPPRYYGDPIRGMVIDEETGKPLSGAVVLAAWLTRGLEGDGPAFVIQETVTNSSGQFLIPGWGPKFRRPLLILSWRSPEIVVFKPGYLGTTVDNGIYPSRRNPGNPAHRSSKWDGKTIAIGKAKNPMDEARQLRFAGGFLWGMPPSAAPVYSRSVEDRIRELPDPH